MKYILALFLSAACINASAQQNTTAEDALHSDSSSFLSRTSVGGYGNAYYQRDFNEEFSTINLQRFVLFVGHKFNKKISFFSELEIEDAKIEGGEEGGEVALEQCYLKFNVNPDNYFVAGLFLPRIGIINENHLPNTYNGNERPLVERYIIPTTWRELGIGYYGKLHSLPVSYSAAVLNGLNSAAFEHGKVIRSGRYEGSNASANNLAFTGSLKYNRSDFTAQVSGYYGGSVGLAPRDADSLKLTSGTFGTPVMLVEGNLQYEAKGFMVRMLASIVSIPDASDINRAYANNTPETAYGLYGEIAYNIFYSATNANEQQLFLFARFEKLDMNATIPENGIINETLNQEHLIAGLTYLPTMNVAIKADVRMVHTGEENPDLIINPSPVDPPYKVNNTFLNIGIGFSF